MSERIDFFFFSDALPACSILCVALFQYRFRAVSKQIGDIGQPPRRAQFWVGLRVCVWEGGTGSRGVSETHIDNGLGFRRRFCGRVHGVRGVI